MNRKKLKYQELLAEFPNCPPSQFEEVKRVAFRWVHKPIISTDFQPLNIIKEPPQRMLEDSDKMCMGYGLSVFDTFENSVERYKAIFKKIRKHQKEQFKEDKGDCVASLILSKADGIADNPNKHGYFTFYEYLDIDLEESVEQSFEIFKDNGEFINQ
jgi:hypothetical protein